jgi:hypothetical protein
MSKETAASYLERVYVASPCSAEWDAMLGGERSRLCTSCDRAVYNIAGLTADEAATLIGKKQGRMCVRLHRRADGTVITRDCPVGLWAYRKRAAVFAGSVLAAILSLFSTGAAQRMYGVSQGIRTETFIESPMVSGRVTDASGSPIQNATVTLTNSNGRTLTRRTDTKGQFQITALGLDKGRNRIKISANGFSTFADEFLISRREALDYPIALEAATFIGVVEIRSEPAIDMRKTDVTTTLGPRKP